MTLEALYQYEFPIRMFYEGPSMNSSPSPLMQAYFLLQEAAQEGFDWDSPFGAASKVKEELDEVIEELHKADTPTRQAALKEEIGDLFLACCCLARHCNVEPEDAITLGLKKFMKRYTRFKFYAKERGISLQDASSDQLQNLWQFIKQVAIKKD